MSWSTVTMINIFAFAVNATIFVSSPGNVVILIMAILNGIAGVGAVFNVVRESKKSENPS